MKTTIIGQKADEPTNLETVKMSIDADSVDVLMTNLTNLYANPVLAVVREYSSNALDSHIRSGQTAPIKVTMPTESNPVFSVQDFGIGMSKEEIANIYSRYGLSTKNKDNNEIGAFGLGAKSALAIADRFDVVAIKDGIKTIAFIKKNNNGVGVVHFVSEEATSEANGFTVSVPVAENKVSSFNETKSIFNTWKIGSALIDGTPNAGIQYGENWLEIVAGETIGWTEIKKTNNYRHGHSYYGGIWNRITFVIGGIPYNFEKNNFGFAGDTLTAPLGSGSEIIKRVGGLLAYENNVVLNLPIGSVDLTPSRENLMITEKTINTVVAVLNDFADNVRLTMTNYIQGLEIDEAYKIYACNFSYFADEVDYTRNRWGRSVNIYDARPEFYGVNYRGEEMPTWVALDNKNYGFIESFNGQALEDADFATKAYTLNSLVSGNYSDRGNNITVQIDATTLTADHLANVRKNLRDYGKAVFGDTTISAIITTDNDINKWVSITYPAVSFDVFAETARKYRSQKKSEAQVGTRRSAISYVTLDLDPNSNTYEELHKTTVDVIGDGSDYIFVSSEQDTLNAFGTYSVWNDVKEASQRDKGYSFRNSFLGDAYKVFGNKKIVFIPNGKSIDAFIKRSPKAVSYKTAIANAVKASEKAGTYNVAIGAYSFAFKNITSNTKGGHFDDKMVQVVTELKANHLADIADDFKREVFTTIANGGQVFALAKMLPELSGFSGADHGNIFVEANAINFQDKYSLLGKIYDTRHFTSSEAYQVVALINGMK